MHPRTPTVGVVVVAVVVVVDDTVTVVELTVVLVHVLEVLAAADRRSPLGIEHSLSD